MRLQTCLKTGGVILAIGMLAACGSSSTHSSSTGPAPTASFESKFGSEFAMIFDASSTSQPATPDSSAVPALAPAAQPIPVP